MSDWNLFVREARAGNFRENRSLAMRSLSRGAGSKQLVRELILKIHWLVGRDVAESRIGIVEGAGIRHSC